MSTAPFCLLEGRLQTLSKLERPHRDKQKLQLILTSSVMNNSTAQISQSVCPRQYFFQPSLIFLRKAGANMSGSSQRQAPDLIQVEKASQGQTLQLIWATSVMNNKLTTLIDFKKKLFFVKRPNKLECLSVAILFLAQPNFFTKAWGTHEHSTFLSSRRQAPNIIQVGKASQGQTNTLAYFAFVSDEQLNSSNKLECLSAAILFLPSLIF